MSSSDSGSSEFVLGLLRKACTGEDFETEYDHGVDWWELESVLSTTTVKPPGTEYYTAENYKRWKTVQHPQGLNVDGHIIRFVEQQGGGEGSGEYMHIVVSVVFPDLTLKHYMKTGYYASHGGSDWDGSFDECTPKAVTKIEWS